MSPNETHGGKNIMSEPPLTEVNMGDERIPSGPHPGIRSLASADQDLPDRPVDLPLSSRRALFLVLNTFLGGISTVLYDPRARERGDSTDTCAFRSFSVHTAVIT